MSLNPNTTPRKGSEKFSLTPFILGFVFVVAEYIYIIKKSEAAPVNMLLAIVPAAIVTYVIRWFAKPEMIGFRILNLGFLYGACPTIALATAGSLTLTYLPIPGYLIAGFVEEGVKAFIIIMLLKKWSGRYKPIEVMFLGMAIGGGFAFTENMMYFMQPGDKFHLGLMFLGRGIITPFAHPLFTAILGYYIGLAFSAARSKEKNSLIAKGFIYSALLHSGFDWSTKYLSAMTLSVSFLTLIGVEAFLSRTRARENKLILNKLLENPTVLKPAERGWITSLTERKNYQKLLNKSERYAFNRWIQLWREVLLAPTFDSQDELLYINFVTNELRREWDSKHLTDKYLTLPRIDLEDYQAVLEKYQPILSSYINLENEYNIIRKIKEEKEEVVNNDTPKQELITENSALNDPYGLDEGSDYTRESKVEKETGEFNDKYTLGYEEGFKEATYLINEEDLGPNIKEIDKESEVNSPKIESRSEKNSPSGEDSLDREGETLEKDTDNDVDPGEKNGE